MRATTAAADSGDAYAGQAASAFSRRLPGAVARPGDGPGGPRRRAAQLDGRGSSGAGADSVSTVAPSQPSRDEARAHAVGRLLAAERAFAPAHLQPGGLQQLVRGSGSSPSKRSAASRSKARAAPSRAAPAPSGRRRSSSDGRPRTPAPWSSSSMSARRRKRPPPRVPLHDPALLRAVEPGRVEHDQVLAQPRAEVEALRRVDVVREQRAVGDRRRPAAARRRPSGATPPSAEASSSATIAVLCAAAVWAVRPVSSSETRSVWERSGRFGEVMSSCRSSNVPRARTSISIPADLGAPGHVELRVARRVAVQLDRPCWIRRSPRRIRISPPSSRLTCPDAVGWASVPDAVNSPTHVELRPAVADPQRLGEPHAHESGRLSPTDTLPCSAASCHSSRSRDWLLLVEVRRVVGLCRASRCRVIRYAPGSPGQAERPPARPRKPSG